MASQLKVILEFSIPGGGSQSQPHGLNWNGTPVVPDHIEAQQGGFEITADDTNITVTGVGTVLVLAESWHTIEREFGGVQNTSLIPQPFVLTGGGSGSIPTPPFNLATVTIYARTTGSDITGNGSLANPYATFQRAIRDVPNILDPGVGYVVDITGITETLPHDYEFPVIEATSLFNGGLTVTATPRLTTLLSPADATIGAADAAVVSSGVGAPVPSSNLVTLTIGVARPAWAGNALKGKQLMRSSQTIGGPAGCAIYGSDATHLYLCQDANALNGGNGPLVLAGGETLQIVEPSATLTGSPPTVNFGAISCWNVSQISFVGIHFVSPGANPALAIGNASGPSIIGCVVEGLYAINTPNALFIDATNLQFSYDLEPVPGIPTRTLFSNFNLPPPYAGNGSYFYIADQLQTFDDVVFDNTCPTLTPGNFTNAQLPSNWGFQNVLFQGSRGDAIQATNGQWGLVNVEIDNAAGNAITVSGGGATFMTLTNVGGGNSIPTANAGYGVRAINGSRVLVDPITMVDPIAVTGSLGDTKSGNLAVTTWLQVGEGKAYDLPLNQPFITNATGTCIQLLDVA